MKCLKHQVVGSEYLKKLHREGKTKPHEGEYCIIGFESKHNSFICEYSLHEYSFYSYYLESTTFFNNCPVCGKELNIQFDKEMFGDAKIPNPFKPGDKVRIGRDIKDAYQEVWHHKGEILKVRSIAEDGEGLMFGSGLGIHFSEVESIEEKYYEMATHRL